MTQRHESSVILTKTNDENHVRNCYRLIQTIDIFHGIHIFSVFLTTTAYGITDEELYMILRTKQLMPITFSDISVKIK